MTAYAERSGQAADVVAIYLADTDDDIGISQVLALLRPMTAMVYETADLMEHPVEDGSMIADHLVLNPTEVELPCMAQSPDLPAVLDEARELFEGGTLLDVQTRSGAILNLVLIGMPHEETPQAIDSPSVLLRFRQARFIEAEYGELKAATVQQPRNASTTARGQQPARPAAATGTTSATRNQAQAVDTERRGSVLYRAFRGNPS